MAFVYERGGRVDDILAEAIRHTRTRGEDAIFTINGVNIIVTERSNLAYIWSDYFDTPKGRTVGPCEIPLSNAVAFPKGFETWPEDQRTVAFTIINKLLEASK